MITKAVIPAAGLGTRFLPATKAQPKEMLPIIDTPTIQYVVEEAVDSGISDILIITGKGKRALEDHFDRNFELEHRLESKKDPALLEQVRRTADMANIHFIRQKEQNGLGDAILYAREHVGREPFAVLLGDTIVDPADPAVPVTRQLMEAFETYKKTFLAVEVVPEEKVTRYGMVDGKEVSPGIHQVSSLVEKPSVNEAPSNLAIAGRYILTPEIFEVLDQTPRANNNEIQLTDALLTLIEREPVYTYTIQGRRFDIGNKLDYLKTQVEYGLKRKEFAAPFKAFLEKRLQ